MEGKYVEGIGNVRISEDVISTIVAVAALEVKGVVALTPRPAADIKGLLPGKKTPAKNVRVDEQNGQVVIELGVTIEFGHKLQEVSLSLQTEVKKAVESMTGLTVSCRQRLCAGRQAARAQGRGGAGTDADGFVRAKGADAHRRRCRAGGLKPKETDGGIPPSVSCGILRTSSAEP